MKKKWIAMACAATLLATTISGCGTTAGTEAKPAADGKEAAAADDTKAEGDKMETAAGDVVEITIGVTGGQSSADMEVWPTAVVEQLESKLGVKLTLVGYDEERLNLDLASGQLSDIMMVYPKHMDGVLKGGHALALDPYLDNIGANIGSEKMQLRNDIVRQFRSNGSNELFFTTPQVTDSGVGGTAPLLGLGYGVRWDLYKEIGAPVINSGDDYIDAMLKMKELYPETPEGLPVYATSAYNDLGTHAWTMRGLLDKGYATLDGTSMYTVDVSSAANDIFHNVFSDSMDTPFWSDMKFYNRMWNEGLLDPDCFITKGEDMIDKYAKGQYLGAITGWHYGKWNDAQAAADPETTKGFVILPSYMGWSNATYEGGWADKLFFVASGGPNTDKAVAVLDYLSSTEYARIANSGIEGMNWEVKDGVPVLTADTIDMKSNPARMDDLKKSGIAPSATNNMLNYLGNAGGSLCEDGYPASLWDTPEIWASTLNSTEKDMCKTLGVQYPSQVLEDRIEAGTSIDQRQFNTLATMCMPAAPKDITRIDNNCVELVINALPSIVQAENEEAFNKAKEQLIADLKGADVETAIEWWTTNWNDAKKAVDEISK